jgi:DNA-binding NarL/FixJ family response regulator
VNKQIRVLIVDDQASVRRGLRMRLGLEADIEVVGEASDGAEAVAASSQIQPDVILMDVEMPLVCGISATMAITQSTPHAEVVILSLHDDIDTRERARAAGATGFVAKHEIDRALTDAIRSAATRSG